MTNWIIVPLQLQIHNKITHTTVLLLVWNMSGSTRVSRYQKGKTKKVKTNLDLLEHTHNKISTAIIVAAKLGHIHHHLSHE